MFVCRPASQGETTEDSASLLSGAAEKHKGKNEVRDETSCKTTINARSQHSFCVKSQLTDSSATNHRPDARETQKTFTLPRDRDTDTGKKNQTEL